MTNQSHTELAAHMALVENFRRSSSRSNWAAVEASARKLAALESPEPVPSNLHTFLDAAAGEGLVLGGIDAADLYVELFPKTHAGIVTKEST